MKNKRELLFSITKKDFEITWFSGKGAGGQHRNKHQNCCRLKHLDSGVISIGQKERSRQRNLKFAFNNLISNPKFKIWLRIKTSQMSMNEKSIEDLVNEAMELENLKIEVGERF